jgi:hypothetical protein
MSQPFHITNLITALRSDVRLGTVSNAPHVSRNCLKASFTIYILQVQKEKFMYTFPASEERYDLKFLSALKLDLKKRPAF